MDLYQQYISKSRYARFIPEQNRREHWEETVNRYITYMCDHVQEKNKVKIPFGKERILKLGLLMALAYPLISFIFVSSLIFNCIESYE